MSTSKVFPYYYLISIDILEPYNSAEQRAEGSKRIEGHTKTFYEVARSVFYVLTKNSSLLKGNNMLVTQFYCLFSVISRNKSWQDLQFMQEKLNAKDEFRQNDLLTQ